MNTFPVVSATLAILSATAQQGNALSRFESFAPFIEEASPLMATVLWKNQQPEAFTFIIAAEIPESKTSLSTALKAKISELASLPNGWDTRGRAIAPIPASLSACVHACEQLADWTRTLTGQSFNEPFLAPNYDGCIQMEWNSPLRTLEAEAGRDGWSVVGIDRSGQSDNELFETELPFESGDALNPYYQWFTGTRAEWPV